MEFPSLYALANASVLARSHPRCPPPLWGSTRDAPVGGGWCRAQTAINYPLHAASSSSEREPSHLSTFECGVAGEEARASEARDKARPLARQIETQIFVLSPLALQRGDGHQIFA